MKRGPFRRRIKPAFDRFLLAMAVSGPVPSTPLKARAYKRLQEMIAHG